MSNKPNLQELGNQLQRNITCTNTPFVGEKSVMAEMGTAYTESFALK